MPQARISHTHGIDFMSEPASGAASNTGSAGGGDNRPEFVELAFIVRVR